jgi:hypothetical protein
MKSRWDPAVFDGQLPRGASFINIDGLTEINNHFLVVEHKSRNCELPKGQKLALERLAALPRLRVWVIRDIGPDAPGYMEVTNMASTESRVVTQGELKEMVREWGEWADRQPRMGS